MTSPRSRSTASRASARLSAFLAAVATAAGLVLATPTCALAQLANVQITKLQDVSFSLLNPTVNATPNAQSICVYNSGALSKQYSVKGTGSGAGGAFLLSGGGSLTLAYGVQWSASTGASTGTALSAGVALTGQTTNATASGCASGPPTTATLIITLAASDLQSASAGVSYTGTLSLLITPQ